MTAHVSPVQVLQRELDAFRSKKLLLKGDPSRAGITIHVPVFEAMLELASAVAVGGCHNNKCKTVTSSVRPVDCDCRIPELLARLNEVLQQ